MRNSKTSQKRNAMVTAVLGREKNKTCAATFVLLNRVMASSVEWENVKKSTVPPATMMVDSTFLYLVKTWLL
jgi:hypothetical protein